MINHLFTKKYTLWDLIIFSLTTGLILKGQWWIAILIFILGAILSAEMDSYMLVKQAEEKIAQDRYEAEMEELAGIQRDKEWQDLAKTGYFVPAVKKHREIHGSSLYDAKQAVDLYIAKNNIREPNRDW